MKDSKDYLDLIMQQADDAEASLNSADYSLVTSESLLTHSLNKVSELRLRLEKAKKEMHGEQWKYELAINRLYIAQAKKESADRRTAIALAEGSLSDHNVGGVVREIGSRGRKFMGCSGKAYPTISGTGQIREKMEGGFVLSSGHELVYGDCSEVG